MQTPCGGPDPDKGAGQSNRRHGTLLPRRGLASNARRHRQRKTSAMNSIIYIVGLVVVVLFILSMLGLR